MGLQARINRWLARDAARKMVAWDRRNAALSFANAMHPGQDEEFWLREAARYEKRAQGHERAC